MHFIDFRKLLFYRVSIIRLIYPSANRQIRRYSRKTLIMQKLFSGTFSNIDNITPRNIFYQYAKFQTRRRSSLGGVRDWTDRYTDRGAWRINNIDNCNV